MAWSVKRRAEQAKQQQKLASNVQFHSSIDDQQKSLDELFNESVRSHEQRTNKHFERNKNRAVRIFACAAQIVFFFFSHSSAAAALLLQLSSKHLQSARLFSRPLVSCATIFGDAVKKVQTWIVAFFIKKLIIRALQKQSKRKFVALIRNAP